MALITLIEEETNLAGVLESQLNASDGDGSTFTATFYDTKTGEQRTPQSTTLTLILNKDSKKAERIRLAGHSTASGLTTCTIATNGRSLPMYGTGAGTTTGQQHNVGDSIGCVTNHEGVSQLNDFVDGTKASNANAIRVGSETDVDIRYYAQNADANKPYLGYDSATNTWVFSNDGSSSTAIGSGASAYTAGDGLTLTASDFDIDTSDTVIFVNTSAGAGDAAKVPILGANGLLNLTFITTGTGSDYITGASANVTGANLSTLTAGPSSNADALHSHAAASESFVAAESISAGDAVALLPYQVEWFTQLTETDLDIGDANARRRRSIKFTPPKDVTGVPNMNFRFKKFSSGQDVTIRIETDNSGEPSGTLVDANATATITAASIATSYGTELATWAGSFNLTGGTTYHIVAQVASTDGTNYVSWGANATYDENYITFTTQVYDLDAGTWGGSVTNATPFFWTNTTPEALGFALVKTDSDAPGRCWRFKGIAEDSVSEGGTTDVYQEQVPTALVASMSGVTTYNVPYYLSGTAGQLTTSPPSPLYSGTSTKAKLEVGYLEQDSDGNDNFIIKVGPKRIVAYETGITATQSTQYILWFHPEYIRADAAGHGTNWTSQSSGQFDGTNQFCATWSQSTAGSVSSEIDTDSIIFVDDAAGGPDDFDGQAGSLTDIGFTLTLTEQGTATVSYQLEIKDQ